MKKTLDNQRRKSSIIIYLYQTVVKMTQRSWIKFSSKMSKILVDDEKRKLLWENLKHFDRDLLMSKSYVEWRTLSSIALDYWVSRERVRQIVERVAQQQDKLVKMFEVIESF